MPLVAGKWANVRVKPAPGVEFGADSDAWRLEVSDAQQRALFTRDGLHSLANFSDVLPVGDYTVRLVRPGHSPVERTLTAGDTQELLVR